MEKQNSLERIHAVELLHQMLGADEDFRPGQWEAIEAIAIRKQRILVIQRTGWGKSLVYFLATKLLREAGAGPTLIISPLLSLMRNQIGMANRIGINAYTINSANRNGWDTVEQALILNECDVIYISPERLNNEYFQNNILPRVSRNIGLFVVDEAHCISDWGHDFRPDYRCITRALQRMPNNMPVLGTTATANNRVVEDIQKQLGASLLIQHGPLNRESLRLQNITLETQPERLAWLAENLTKFHGKSGIIYCLTRADTENVASWLKHKGFSAKAYHADNENANDRESLEEAFLDNTLQILVATVALGMGFDKPDIAFVIHFQRPSSVIAYYQQVGRAGRELDKSYGILLSGAEDDDISKYFIKSAYPPRRTFRKILQLLQTQNVLSFEEIVSLVNTTETNAQKTLRLLIAGGAIKRVYNNGEKFQLTPNLWQPEPDRIDKVIALRQSEQAQMQDYTKYKGCLMEYLLRALDDPSPQRCHQCANCQGKGFPGNVTHELVLEAEAFIGSAKICINTRTKWPKYLMADNSQAIRFAYRNMPGYALCQYWDGILGTLVKSGKYEHGLFSDELVKASCRLIIEMWRPEPFPTWVTAIPSLRHPNLVPDFASRLAAELNLPFRSVLLRSNDALEQKTMQNGIMRAENVLNSLTISATPLNGPVLLVDDIVDSGWTMTVAGYLLRKKASGLVFPFALAKATGKDAGL